MLSFNLKTNTSMEELKSTMATSKIPHALVVPSPAQGHVMPIMELSHRLVDHGVKVTLVNAESVHAQVMAAMAKPEMSEEQSHRIQLVSIPDGMATGGDRREMSTVMCRHFEELIKKIESDGGEKITCVIADLTMGWALDVVKKMEIKRVAFWAVATGVLTLMVNVPKLIKAGIIDDNGTPPETKMIRLSPAMPAMSTADFPWIRTGNPVMQKIIFGLAPTINQALKSTDCLICNSMYELEPASFDSIPGLLPIGPCIPSNHLGQPAGHFWPADLTCLTWLDTQLARSVIYIAFGSIASFDQHQFDELALGLELSRRPFLWVIRPDVVNGLHNTFLDDFREKMGSHGKIVTWAPQKEVLAHPSIACFITHCGWNSTMEGLRSGVPFLCFPYFADQFYNQGYVCDVWNVGLRLNPDGNGIVSRDEIKMKVENLLCDEGIKAKALEIQKIAIKGVGEDGSSSKNFEDFLEMIKS